LAQCHIELDTSIPPAHQTKYKMNPNYRYWQTISSMIYIA
jgi:hypothetical protein